MRLVSPASNGSSVKGAKEVQKKFYITGDLNVELGMICTDENDIEELNEMYGPLCWHVYVHDPGGYKKIMWCSIMKEFNCEVPSMWSNDDRTKDAAFTQRKQGDGGQEKVSQLDFIIEPEERHDDCFINNEGKMVGDVGSLPDIRKDSGRKRCGAISGKKKTRTGVDGHPRRAEHKIEFIKKVMENDGRGVDESLTKIQKQLNSKQEMWRIAPKLREKF